MNDPLLKKIKLKSLEEIIARARELISRHRRRFLTRNLRPCPYNCLAYETPILLKDKGAVSIGKNLGSQTVLNSKGRWVSAEIRSFGTQSLREVRISYIGNSHPISVFATPTHRWKLTNGSEKITDELKKGDGLPFITVRQKRHQSIDYLLGIKHGLIYGDGTAHWIPSRKGSSVRACKRVEGYQLRICGDVSDILPYFVGYPISYPPSAGGDPIVKMFDSFAATHELKSLPSKNETEDYLVGFFRGWLAADGSVSKKDGSINLCCGSDEEAWLRETMPRFGYYFLSASPATEKTNFGRRNKDTRSVYIFRYSMSDDDFLIARKRRAFCKKFANFRFVVQSTKSTDRVEEVFCAVVPDTEDFVIDRGILTGNCSMAETMGRKITGCFGCESHDPNKCLDTEKFKPAYTKEELATQFAEELRDPGVLLRDYRDVVVFLWVLGAFDEEKRVDEEIVSKVEKKHVADGSSTVNSDPNRTLAVETHNVQGDERPTGSRPPVLPRDSDGSEPNYNRAENNYSSTDVRHGGGGKVPDRVKSRTK